jgi:hypothetical protein
MLRSPTCSGNSSRKRATHAAAIGSISGAFTEARSAACSSAAATSARRAERCAGK